MSTTDVNLFALDAAYKSFPSFQDWLSNTKIDAVRWDRYTSTLHNRESMGPDVLKRARDIATRAAALDTGAIEGLYEVDRGFTYTVAFETSTLEAAFAQKGEYVRSLFEAQLSAYDYVLDFATKAEPISEAAIRRLHEVVCQAQPTYRVITAIGPQEQPLPKGVYKALPNHVRTRKGTDHSYAPVDVTPAEMARLVSELRTETFLSAHPVLQAAYAHYALVVIHPFSDGNGRVARALASAFTYRTISMPIVILSEHKDSYLNALENSDAREYQVFVDFMLARALDTIKLVDDSFRTALAPSPERNLTLIESMYVTSGGYTYEQVDSAGTDLVGAFVAAIQENSLKYTSAKVTSNVNQTNSSYPLNDGGYRLPVSGGKIVQVVLMSVAPAASTAAYTYVLFVPKDAGGDDDLLLKSLQPPYDTFVARLDEILPSISGVLRMRLSMTAERILRELLAQLRIQVAQVRAQL